MSDINTLDKANEINRFRGDTYPIIVTIKENGIPIDLSAAVSKMTIAFTESPAVTIIGENITGSDGMVRFNISDEIADNIGRFFYDVQVDSGGYKTTYTKNIINFIKDVTLG